MSDPTIPKFKRIQAGHYVATCGDETVRIMRFHEQWRVKPWGRQETGVMCATLSGAKEWAFDWLAEHA